MIKYVVVFSLIITDLLSKKAATLFLNTRINLIWDFLSLKLTQNSWIAFSLPLSWIILKIITIILIVWIIYFYEKYEKIKQEKILDFWYYLIIGWAIGNWIERLINSSVTDFISIKYFAIFNFADIFINVWVILILFYYSKQSWKNNQKTKKTC